MSWFNATTWGQLQEKDKDGERKETHERGFYIAMIILLVLMILLGERR